MSKAPKPKVTRSLTCNCQKVQVTVTGIDKGAVLCHCSNCQKASGSAFAHNHRFMEATLQFDKGRELMRRYADDDTKTGNILYRHFCGNCGCPLYLQPTEVKDLVIFHSGLIEGERTQPRMELFLENKYAWVGDVTSKAKI